MKRLRAWLENTETTQKEFGELVGVKQSTVSDWLTGDTVPTPRKLLDISKKTSIPIEKLLQDCAHNVAARAPKRTERQTA